MSKAREIPRDHVAMAEALQIAGVKVRRILTDAEIAGCWAFAWLPEASGKVTHKFLEPSQTFDPITSRYLNPCNLRLGAFIDAFSKHPEEVLKLLQKFRDHIRKAGGTADMTEGSVHSAMLDHGTGKEAAHRVAKLAGIKTEPELETVGRKIRRAAALVKGKGSGWPMLGGGTAEPVPRKPKERTNSGPEMSG